MPLCSRIKPTRSVVKQISTNGNRHSLPKRHSLRHAGIDSVPSSIKYVKKKHTIDTPENRFIKFAFQSFVTFLDSIGKKLGQIGEPKESRLFSSVNALAQTMQSYLQRPFFREVSLPHMLPLGSPTLQKKGGYREVLRAWLLFNAAAKLSWAGGDDVYSAGKRDVAVLYEYWCFFRLLDIVENVFVLDVPTVESLIAPTRDGFGVTLKSGKSLSVTGVYNGFGRKLQVKLCFNRTFSRAGGENVCNYPLPGSWTERMRPDYTISMWPAELSESQAERAEVMTHVHFDAKYKVDNVEQLFGKTDSAFSKSDLEKQSQQEAKEQLLGSYKRADLLKMHAYRDAIRRTAGAYVIYPGTEKREWRGFHELIPGLGAFPMRPSKGVEDGANDISSFIKSVAEHVSSAATQSELLSYYNHQAHKGLPVDVSLQKPLKASLIETETDFRQPPLTAANVGVVNIKSLDDWQWIVEHEEVIICLNDHEPVEISKTVTSASFIVLQVSGEEVIPGLLEVVSAGPLLTKTSELPARWGEKVDSNYCLKFHTNSLDSFVDYSWDTREVTRLSRDTGISSFRTITLVDLLTTFLK